MYKEHIFSRGNDLKLAAFKKKKIRKCFKKLENKNNLKKRQAAT